MKVKERRHRDQGLGGGYTEVRVVEVDAAPAEGSGAEIVPDETPVSDWAREGEA